jgi:hypothetical protein
MTENAEDVGTPGRPTCASEKRAKKLDLAGVVVPLSFILRPSQEAPLDTSGIRSEGEGGAERSRAKEEDGSRGDPKADSRQKR